MAPKAGMPPKANKGEAGKGGKDNKKNGKDDANSVEDKINLHQLVELKAAFDRADVDGGGSLDMDEFLEAFGEVLGKNLTHEQLTHLFMKIDANSDGSVDWDEFTNYMLLETQAASDMSDRSFQVRYQDAFDKNLGPVWVDPNPKSLHHRDMIGGVLAIPKQEKFVTHSRDGSVRVWHAGTLAHLRTLRVSTSQVTDCKHFSQTNRLVASSIDRAVTFYDAASYEVTAQLTGLDTSPMCIGYWQDLEMESEKMILGDDQGNIALYDVHGGDNLQTEPGSACAVRLYRDARHADWVTQCNFYPELNFMVSSSLDGTIKIGDIERRSRHCRQLGEVGTSTATTPYTCCGYTHYGATHSMAVYLLGGQAWHEQGHLLLRVVQPLQGAHASYATSSHACYGHADRGYTCHDAMLTVATLTRQVLASCGLERAISIWNPYTRGGKPMAQLVGHTSSVQHVTINEENYQLISCDLSKTMKVWDMRNYKCLQTIQDKARCSVAIVSIDPGQGALPALAMAYSLWLCSPWLHLRWLYLLWLRLLWPCSP